MNDLTTPIRTTNVTPMETNMNTNKNQPRTSRVPSKWASEGGVRQEGDLPLYVCNKCNAEVVWATSSKTGRKYLVTCSRLDSDSVKYFYAKHNVHTDEACTKQIERTENLRKQLS